jgi:hypothetical protein
VQIIGSKYVGQDRFVIFKCIVLYFRRKPPVKPVDEIVLQARTVTTNKVGGIVGRGHRTPP